jgi:hypothetical protein
MPILLSAVCGWFCQDPYLVDCGGTCIDDILRSVTAHVIRPMIVEVVQL